MSNTFPAVLPGSEITFQLCKLTFNQQEKAIHLLDGFSKSVSQMERFASIRELMTICVAGWDRPEPIEYWADHIDAADAIHLVEVCVKGNTTSEEERKK